MAFEPDIVVSANDGTSLLLVAETKSMRAAPEALGLAETQLKRYMIGMRCGIGMLVTPETVRIFRDPYRGYTPDSIELVGDFEFPADTDEGAGSSASSDAQFEAFVQRWLENLKDPNERARLPSPLREAIDEHIVPVLRRGEVRAAHHRRLVSRASDRGRSA